MVILYSVYFTLLYTTNVLFPKMVILRRFYDEEIILYWSVVYVITCGMR